MPLEIDLTTYRAYTLNQSTIWKLGKLDFLAPAERIPSQLILNQPYDPDRIPVVFVHGTFSSPVTWAEMANTLTADPVLRQRYQIWSFIYGSGNPLVQSVADLRAALTAEVQRLDPQGTNAALRQMVVIGHSQGGLLTKGTAIDTGDRLWRVVQHQPAGGSEDRRGAARGAPPSAVSGAAAVCEPRRVHRHPAPRQLPRRADSRAGWRSDSSRCPATMMSRGEERAAA